MHGVRSDENGCVHNERQTTTNWLLVAARKGAQLASISQTGCQLRCAVVVAAGEWWQPLCKPVWAMYLVGWENYTRTHACTYMRTNSRTLRWEWEKNAATTMKHRSGAMPIRMLEKTIRWFKNGLRKVMCWKRKNVWAQRRLEISKWQQQLKCQCSNNFVAWLGGR